MDGGICSQMHFYLLGEALREEKGCCVTYDLRWYDTCGKDMNGKHERRFDLLKAFPRAPFRAQANSLLRRLYFSLFWAELGKSSDFSQILNLRNISAPANLEGYFHESDSLFKDYYRKIFRVDTSVLPEDNLEILERIEKNSNGAAACAIHVRRGDLSTYHLVYGSPVNADYIRQGVEVVKKECNDVRFFIFSDDPEWTRENVMPIFEENQAEIVDINGADRGWCDLLLMSRCRYQITSQGSMGKYAAMLRREEDMAGLVVLPPNKSSEEWARRLSLSITIGNQ